MRGFFDRLFVERDPLGVSRADGFRYSWESFCDHTKHNARFVFFKERRVRRRKYEGPEEWEGQSVPYHILLAFAEIFDRNATAKGAVTFAAFGTTRGLLMLDLTDVPDVPSIFDEVRYDERPSLIFLQHFRSEISKPIDRDDRIHYEYVPTQIVAEYFRHIYREGRRQVDGVMFNSTQRGTGVCYCMFATADSCTDGPKFTREHMLLLKKCRTAKIDFAKRCFT